MIDVRHLSYSIQDNPIISNLNFIIPGNCVFHIKADNGAGKTTLLQLLCGLRQPEDGDVFFNMCSIYDQLKAYQRHINYIGHQIPLQNELSIQEHWRLSNLDKNLYSNAVEHFKLRQCHQLPVRHLSSGQRKKAVLMSLIVNLRPIWILDEPFVSLDMQGIETLIKLIEKHVTNKGTVILTSHQMLPDLTCEVRKLKL